ncbi:MAG: hypothetical protein ACTIAG_04530 [Lactobacillus sp.]
MKIELFVNVIGNIGGLIALANFIVVLVKRLGKIDVRLTDVWDVDVLGGPKEQIHNAHIVLTNNSNRVLFVYSMSVNSSKQRFDVATSGGFLMIKKFGDYKYPLFRTEFPVTLGPGSTINLRVEVIGEVKWSDLNSATLNTQQGAKQVTLSTKEMKQVDQYQFR